LKVLKPTKPRVFDHDLDNESLSHYLSQPFVTVDTETRGLNVRRDRLCLVQVCDGDGLVSLIRYRDKQSLPIKSQTNIKRLLEAPEVVKVFHYARFDVAVLKYYLGAQTKPIWCTKIASKLVRTYADRHSLRDLAKDLLGVEMDKTDQMSDWAREDLTDSQFEYAANDVRLLVPIYTKMKALVEREELTELAEKLFNFVEVVCELDLRGWSSVFEH
jgi:ribonuclease D